MIIFCAHVLVVRIIVKRGSYIFIIFGVVRISSFELYLTILKRRGLFTIVKDFLCILSRN